jgi:hypothetical protein
LPYSEKPPPTKLSKCREPFIFNREKEVTHIITAEAGSFFLSLYILIKD